MMNMDRTKAPDTESISDISVKEAIPFADKLGFPSYIVHSGTQEVVKIEFIFPAGLFHQNIPFLASTTNAMLQEGTKIRNAKQIAIAMDYYGSFLDFEVGKDYAYASLYSPNKYLENTLPVFTDIMINASIPEKELNIYLNKAKQNFAVNMEKVGFVASNKFNEMLFGKEHPYGKNAIQGDLDNLTRKKIEKYYSDNYKIGDANLIISGNIPDRLEDLLTDQFAKHASRSVQKKRANNIPPIETQVGKEFVSKPGSVQSAIRVGRILFGKKDPDFFGMIVLNTILGGYFGSRLMTNIREDKGYTYGISSSINSAQRTGYLVISTEVGSDVTSDTLNQIYIELKRLREEIVPENELSLVKNYMLGAFLRSTNGPFSLADKFKSILEYNLDYSFYTQFISTVKNITSTEINELANKYLQERDFQELVVGKS